MAEGQDCAGAKMWGWCHHIRAAVNGLTTVQTSPSFRDRKTTPGSGGSRKGLSSSLGQKFQLQGLVCLRVEPNPSLACITNRPKAKQFVWGQAYMFGFASAFCFTSENKRPKCSFSCSHGQVLFLPDDTAL